LFFSWVTLHIKKNKQKLRCVIAIDYHLLSRLIDQFDPPIFFFNVLLRNVHIYHFHVRIETKQPTKKNRKNQSIKGLIIIVYCNTGRLIDEDIFFPSGHKYTCKENCYFSFPFFLITCSYSPTKWLAQSFDSLSI